MHGFNNCPACPFKTATCGNRGPLDASFVIVGESPGVNEVREGKPFVGNSGKLLKSALLEAFRDIRKDPIVPLLTNAMMCHPHAKDLKKLTLAAKACSQRLHNTVGAYPRKVILALGNGAVWGLTGNYSTKITQIRGQVFKSPLAEQGIVATVHPAFLLRGGGSFAKFKDDLRLACTLATGGKNAKYVDSKAIVFTSEEEIRSISRELLLRSKRRLRTTFAGVDIETGAPPGIEEGGFSDLDDDILSIGFGWRFDLSYIIPEQLVQTDATRELFSFSPNVVRWIWHNGKFDYRFLKRKGVGTPRVDEDTMMLSYALDETRGVHDLEQVSANAVNAPNWKSMLDAHMPIKKGKRKKGVSYRLIPTSVLHKYLGKDVSATLQSWYVLRSRVAARTNLELLYSQTLIPASAELADIEMVGMLVDKSQVEKNRVRLQQQVDEIGTRIQNISERFIGKRINPNAPAQVAELLYDGVRIPKFKGQRSTNKDVLKKLPKNPVVAIVLDYRKAAKALSTYVIGLPKNMYSDGCIHTTFLLHGSATGRLASRPNLQNIPRDPELRSQFVCPTGFRFVEVDLNQAELRCLAVYSNCKDLCAIYEDPNHPGLHHEVSVTLFGENYTDEDKMRAKTVNFGIVYGRTGASIAEEYKMPAAEGDRWVSGWFERFPGAAQFIRACREAPLRGEHYVTPFGRSRRFGPVSFENKLDIQNQAANFPHQSTASDINLHGSLKAKNDPRIIRIGSKFCNLVHDSNLAMVPDNDEACTEHIRIVREYLEKEPLLWGLDRIPFIADAKWGYRWGHLVKLKQQDGVYVEAKK